MKTKTPSAAPSGPSFSVNDVYYMLFRHKWKILILTVLGLAAGYGFYKTAPKPYISEAKLLVRYVQEGKGPTADADEDRIKSPDARGGQAIITAELAIINSADLALQVADIVGPEKILAAVGGGNDRNAAAGMVRSTLVATAPRSGSVITVVYEHPDATVVQPVLAAAVDAYLKRHIEIHRPAGTYDDFLTQQTDQMRSRLAQTEEELRKARAKAGIISLEDTRRAQSETINQLKRDMLSVQRNLAQRTAALQRMVNLANANRPAQAPAPEPTAANAPAINLPVDQYRSALSTLVLLRQRERDLLTQFTPENNRVKAIRAQLEEAEAAKTKLETEFPQLLAQPQVIATAATAEANPYSFDFNRAYSEIAGLENEYKILGEQLQEVRNEAAALDSLESNIQELERRKTVEEANYKTFAANLERTRMEEALGPGRVTNISRIQNPTPPARNLGDSRPIAMGIGIGGLVLGLGLAFAIEFFLDRSVRRVSQIERNLGLDVFISIPALKGGDLEAPALGDGSSSSALATARDTSAPWEPANALHAYYAALRDRTINFFEGRNLNHKPRLVALTGLGKDHGAAEIAAGLAGCLSETGEGKVLFVDMTTNQGAAQQFYQGQEVSSISEMLEHPTESKAKVNENLYVVGNEGGNPGDNLPTILPKRFGHLIPKLRATDFDYIIFNLPPVSNLSVTPRLARHMDVVMMVMESEKTDLGAAEKAKSMLEGSRAHVAAILNKTENYVPRRLVKDMT